MAAYKCPSQDTWQKGLRRKAKRAGDEKLSLYKWNTITLLVRQHRWNQTKFGLLH